MFEELVREVILLIEKTEGRARNRTHTAQLRFEHAVHVILLDLWKSIHSLPVRECLINKRSGYYSENPRYRDPLLTYNQTIALRPACEAAGVQAARSDQRLVAPHQRSQRHHNEEAV